MSTKADEREWIAMHLYEEHRVELAMSGTRYSPMWHELDGDEQRRWSGKAARLQDWLVTCRKLQRTHAHQGA